MASKKKKVAPEASQAARVLSRYGAALGGKARWKNITAEERAEHFRQMALERWKQVREQNALENKLQAPSQNSRDERSSGVEDDTEHVCE